MFFPPSLLCLWTVECVIGNLELAEKRAVVIIGIRPGGVVDLDVLDWVLHSPVCSLGTCGIFHFTTVTIVCCALLFESVFKLIQVFC